MMIYVWYPSDVTAAGRVAPYIPGWSQEKSRISESVKRALGDGTAYCALEQDRLLLHAIDDAPVAAALPRYPVLLFSHGTAVASLTYAAQHEELASHGYVVVAIEYTPATNSFIVFPDGRTVRFDPNRWENPGKNAEEILQWEKNQIEELATAFAFVLDELVRMDDQSTEPHLLRNRMDFSNVGAFGHSYGGMGALRATQLDERIKSGLGQDASSNGMRAFASDRLAKPFALMFRQLPDSYTETKDSISRLFSALSKNGILLTINGPQIEHLSFSDLVFLRNFDDPDKRADATRNLQIIREITRRFFDVHLKNQPMALLDRAVKEYPEIAIDRRAN